MLLPSPTTSDANGAGAHLDESDLLGTPTARMWKGSGPVGSESHSWLMNHGNVEAQVLTLSESGKAGATSALLPTPAVNDMGAAYTPETWDEWTARMKAAHNNGNGHGDSLNIEAQRLALLPTTTAKDAAASGGSTPHDVTLTDAIVRTELGTINNPRLLPTPKTEMHTKTSAHAREKYGSGDSMGDVVEANQWGKYAGAVAWWESLTRPAPDPTVITDGYLRERAKRLAGLHKKPVGMRGSLKVRRQLAARFSEWMMGVPLDWICGVPGITRNEALKAAGNGVVPQQAAEALRFLLATPTGRDVAGAYEPLDLLELMAIDA